jgi:hypothetical protein
MTGRCIETVLIAAPLGRPLPPLTRAGSAGLGAYCAGRRQGCFEVHGGA